MLKPTPFNKVLIANRGEIALRVMRTARAVGFQTVAVYSSADADAIHVRDADQAVCIGGALPAESYLHVDAIIAAAKKTGADAVHPGYGFLAENAGFAQACRDAGLVFIGPSPQAIDAMGDKAGAKRLMVAAGVPCIPGYAGEDQSDERLLEEAQRIGFPVMIKASAGGGGRGMRLVASADQFIDLLRSARSEALSAFGDAIVILERAIVNARHIEIQVFADRYGNVIHLGERDCSVQRRHQKLIEESPSPAVTPALRERMGEVAVNAAKMINYEGAGTLEFLLDESGAFYFMEMNTRLQVEHPVTEAITGLDLVEWQLRVAAGEALPLQQSDVRFSGHAIEVRLCAEDAKLSFVPQSGTLARWRVPQNVRIEHALHSGIEIAPYYDSMIAKIVGWGLTRDEARRKLITGLGELVALGVTTNQVLLSRCLQHPVFVQGAATTAFIGENLAQLLKLAAELETRAAALAALLLGLTAPHHANRKRASMPRHSFPVPMKFEINGKALNATLTANKHEKFTIVLGADEINLQLIDVDADTARFICDGVTDRAIFHRNENHLDFQFAGISFAVDDQSLVAAIRADEKISDGKVRASMNGRVVAIHARAGDKVSAGQPMIIVEAMKMEHAHRAPFAGTVASIHVAVGDQVATRRIVAEVAALVS
jgi:geranyl-CoA carboxylase alpha subunit